jgi:hypothetical protein
MAGSAHTWVDNDVATAAYLNALPRGVMAYVNGSTSDQAGITTVVDITGLTTTFTAISSRLYRVTLYASVFQVTTAGFATISITDSAGTVLRQGMVDLIVSGRGVLTVVSLETGLSGSITRKGRAATSAGTVTVLGTSLRFAALIVEDLGPA